MKKVNVVLYPMDIVMFRDPRPFELGGYARSYDMPLPSTFSGVIRSLLRETYPDRSYLYEDEKNLIWRLRGPFPSLVKEGKGKVKIERFYPLPNDIFENYRGKLVVPKPSKPYSYRVNGLELLSPQRLKDGKVLKKPKAGLIDERALLDYLEGASIMKSKLVKYERIFVRVRRPGVTLDEKKVVELGRFYRIEALEASWELEEGEIARGGYVGVISSDEDVIGKLKAAVGRRIVRFGGESRPSSVLIIPKKDNEKWKEFERRIASRISREKRFKVYLATPALFGDEKTSRWVPKWLNEQNLGGRFLHDGPRVKLVGASMGKCIGVSGWDYAKACVKPMYFGVPAGSVFYFSIEEDVNTRDVHENIINRLENDNMSDIMRFLGFGTAFVGVW